MCIRDRDTAVQYILDSAPVRAELAKPALVSSARVVVDGTPVAAAAYEIEGNNYFKLRDLCFMLGVSVEWDNNAQTIVIDTSKPYIQ